MKSATDGPAGHWLKRPAVLVGGAAGVVGLAILAVVVWAVSNGSKPAAQLLGETAPAVSDRLVVTVTESGEIDAKRSVDIRCEVEGSSTVIWVIEEGTVVKVGDKLIELDAAELEEQLRTQEMTQKTARAAYEKAEKAFIIQESTRQSLLAQAGLSVKFGLIDLRKYLGSSVADRMVQAEGKLPFDTLMADKDLGGEALQMKRKLESDIALAGEELKRAASKVEWTRTLKEKGYVTGSELEADELAWQRQRVAVEQANTALDLFITYEFPKMAEKYYTDWLEAKREYDRVDARTQSELASAQADLENKREALTLEDTRLKKGRDQLAKTTIIAPQAGLVVYEVSRSRSGSEAPLQAGSTVRHQQTLLKLPDMSEMNVKVKLHESVVKQVSYGDPAYVVIDAMPKDRLTGKVTKIAVMPDRGNWFLNPGLKTYLTEVTLDSTPSGLKPGLSAQVEIMIDARDSVLQVPISAVQVDKGFQVVYLKTPRGTDVRQVEVGMSNDRAVEILTGVAEGEVVYLYKPDGAPELTVSEDAIASRRKAQEDEAMMRAAVERPPAAANGNNAANTDSEGKPERPPRGMENLSPEQVKAMQERFEKMSPEEREAAIKAMRDAAGGTKSETSGPGKGRPDDSSRPPRKPRDSSPSTTGTSP